MGKNWPLLERYFVNNGKRGGKDNSLKFMVRMNELRRYYGHPTKKYVANFSYSDDDRAFVLEVDAFVLALGAAFKQGRSGQDDVPS